MIRMNELNSKVTGTKRLFRPKSCDILYQIDMWRTIMGGSLVKMG